MARQRVKPSGRDVAADNKGLSDEQILAERRRLGSFERADGMLKLLSWFLWGLSGAWFVIFMDFSPEVDLSDSLPGRLANAASVPSLGLLTSGIFCSALSRASPKGTWSTWRCLWHMAWIPCLAVGVLAFARLAVVDRLAAGKQLPAAAPTWTAAAALAAMAVLLLTAAPKGLPDGSRGSSVVFGRMLLLGDALLGGVVCFLVLVAGMAVLSDPLGLATLWASIAPLAMCVAGTLLCRTDSELIAALQAAIFHLVLVVLRLCYTDGPALAALALLAACLHSALFLPLPASDPDTNPFHVWARKALRDFVAMLSSPVEGWGECGED